MNSDRGLLREYLKQRKKNFYSGPQSIKIICGREHEQVVMTLNTLRLSDLM